MRQWLVAAALLRRMREAATEITRHSRASYLLEVARAGEMAKAQAATAAAAVVVRLAEELEALAHRVREATVATATHHLLPVSTAVVEAVLAQPARRELAEEQAVRVHLLL
jgi:anaerobic C4-dicarboxylate transporter